MRFPLRYLIILGAFAALLLGLSACAAYKPETLTVSQPAGVGPVRIHLVLCANSEEGGSSEVKCEGAEATETEQSILLVSVPKGWTAPASFEAPSPTHGPTLRYTRNQEVAENYEFTEESSEGKKTEFPPPGYEYVGYLSAVYEETEGEKNEWEVNIDVAPPAVGAPYGGTFRTEFAWGWRNVSEAEVEGKKHPADRPVDCDENNPAKEEVFTFCEEIADEVEGPVTDLRVAGAASVSVPVGGKATLDFPLAAASTVTNPAPGFTLTAATSIPGGSATPVEPTYSPAYDGTTHQGAAAVRAVAVTMPPTTPPGTYTVTLAAHAPAGGTVANTGQIVVGQLSLGLGKAKRNLKKGTATVTVQVPAAGTLLVSGKGVAKVTKSAPAAGTLKVTVRAKGKAKKQLKKKGKARVKPNFVFTPANGAQVARPKPLILRIAG